MNYIIVILLMLILLCNLFNGTIIHKKNIIENLDATQPVQPVQPDQPVQPYQPYTNLANNPTFLSLQNASNVAFLKSQMSDLTNLKSKVASLSTTVDLNTKGILQISQQINQAGQSAIGGPPPTKPLPQITGLN